MDAERDSKGDEPEGLWGNGALPLVTTPEFEELLRVHGADRELVVRLLQIVWDRYYGVGRESISLREAVERELLLSQRRSMGENQG